MTKQAKDTALTITKARQDTLRGKLSLSMIGLLVVEIIIRYEWLISGLTKIARGDFWVRTRRRVGGEVGRRVWVVHWFFEQRRYLQRDKLRIPVRQPKYS